MAYKDKFVSFDGTNACFVSDDNRLEYICSDCGFEWKTHETKNVICGCGNEMIIK